MDATGENFVMCGNTLSLNNLNPTKYSSTLMSYSRRLALKFQLTIEAGLLNS